MTDRKLKISELMDAIEKVIADPSTRTLRKSNHTFYFLRQFEFNESYSAYRCCGIVRTILGYNARVIISGTKLWIIVAPGIQKNALKSIKSQKEAVEAV
jgi:hypothetical protein